MNILVTCPRCQIPSQRNDTELGVQRKCPHCGYLFIAKVEKPAAPPAAHTNSTGRNRAFTLLDDFMMFRTMITPALIMYVFWIGAFMCLLLGLLIVLGFEYDGNRHDAAEGIGIMLVGPFLLRIICEAVILFYRINETLTEIFNKIKSDA